MATATKITIEEMHRVLRKSQGWSVTYHATSQEFVIDWQINEYPLIVLRVYTSILTATGVTRSAGSDAIRVCAVDLTEGRGYIKAQRVHRVGGWRSNLQARCKTVLSEARNRLANLKVKKVAALEVPALPCASELFNLINYAMASGLKYPKLRFTVAGHGKFVIARAGNKSKHEGALNLTDGKPFGESKWFGRIEPDGRLVKGKQHEAWVDDLFVNMSKEGVLATTAAFGQKSGNCCYCMRSLTTKESVTAGYGPVCATKWGLPWGHVDDSLFGAKSPTEVTL